MGTSNPPSVLSGALEDLRKVFVSSLYQLDKAARICVGITMIMLSSLDQPKGKETKMAGFPGSFQLKNL